MRARILSTALACSLSLLAAAPGFASADPYRAAYRAQLADGVEHARYEANETIVNVAAVSRDAAAHLRPVPAGSSVGVERTSAICQRVKGCLVAINGDFVLGDAPVGALVVDGEMMRSPNPKHHNLMVLDDGSFHAGQLRWRGRLVATDLSQLRLDAVNRERGTNDLVLYTEARGASTRTNAFGAEMRLRSVRGKGLRIGQTGVVRAVSYGHAKGDTPIPAGGAVLSAHGKAARALGSLWERMRERSVGRELLLRIETTPGVDLAIGGTPILLRKGAVWFSDDESAFMHARSPRTMVGWNDRGDLWLATVDGRQSGYSVGMSLREAAEFLRSLGATDAINLDGGGSSTFVVAGRVANKPSDRAVVVDGRTTIVQEVAGGVMAANVERPVANALVLITGARKTDAASGSVWSTTNQPLAVPAPAATDPASNPASNLPVAGAFSPQEPSSPRARGIAIAAALNAVVLLGHLRRRRGAAAAL